MRFSQLVVEQRWIKEIDINPLLASPDGLIALDARVVVHGPRRDARSSCPSSAIRPYPTQYVAPWKMKDGTQVTIRPIRPEDEPLMVKFHETLSERSVYLRYFQPLKLGPARRARAADPHLLHRLRPRDGAGGRDREPAPAASAKILGVGRLSKLHGTNEAEFAVLVSDEWQGQGLGTELVRRLIEVGREEKLGKIIGDVLQRQRRDAAGVREARFTMTGEPDEQAMKAVLTL